MTWLLVVAGGMAGASLRYLTDRAVRSRNGTAFPWGTFAANMLGCLILGVLTGAVLHGAAAEPVRLLAGTGLCGALSTYSTFSYETVRLAESGSRLLAVANVVVSVVAGIAALVAGTAVAEAVWA